MAEHDSDWYIGSRISNKEETSSDSDTESSIEILIGDREHQKHESYSYQNYSRSQGEVVEFINGSNAQDEDIKFVNNSYTQEIVDGSAVLGDKTRIINYSDTPALIKSLNINDSSQENGSLTSSSSEDSSDSNDEIIIDWKRIQDRQRKIELRKKLLANEARNKNVNRLTSDLSIGSSNSHSATNNQLPGDSRNRFCFSEEQFTETPSSSMCPVKPVQRLSVHTLKFKKFKASTKTFAPPNSYVDDGSAWIPKVKRKRLPIEARRDDIVNLIRENRVVILSGSTGCGKSTQVPQYILDDCLQRKEPVNIICTQPRRIAATSLAHRVASERVTKLHGQIGFHIGGKSGYSSATRLRYVTTGILLEMLKLDRFLKSYTHVIMDEIHERNVDDDLMMAHLCVIMRQNPSLKLIIMSATMNVKKFKRYFHEFGTERRRLSSEIPCIDVPVKNFPVDVFYLEDICQELRVPNAFRNSALSEPRKPSMMQERRELFLDWIFHCHATSPVEEAFLVFLPGISLISELEDQLMFLNDLQRREAGRKGEMPNPQVSIIKLHSTVTIDEQCLAMQLPRKGYRKIIYATNVAESSITVPDVRIIFDSCLRKDVFYDKTSRCYSLNEQWISKDCAEQRRGRAGRVGPGKIYRLVPKSFYNRFYDERTPEIKRTPLNSLLLRCIYATFGDPRELLSHCIDPPDDTAVDYALEDLEATGAVIKTNETFREYDDHAQGNKPSYEYEVTRLGAILAQLPLDLHSGLLVVYGALFGVLYDAMIIAAILQNRGVIVQPQGQEMGISAAMKRFHLNLPNNYPLQGGSDLISHLRGYLLWEETVQNDNTFDQKSELAWCQQQFISLYWIREIQDLVITIQESLAYQNICTPPTKEDRDEIRRNRINNPSIYAEDSSIEDELDNEQYNDQYIDQAIRILDFTRYNVSPDDPHEDDVEEIPFSNRSRTYTCSKNNVPLHQLSFSTKKLLNPWMNVFDRVYEVTSRPVQLRREPNTPLLTILLIAAFHQNLFRVTPSTDNRVFKDCPEDYNRQHTIEFVAQMLPPKRMLVDALEKDIGMVQKVVHPDTDPSDPMADYEYCYVEFVKPAVCLWTQSRDRNKPPIPDAVYLAQKLRSVKYGIWTDNITSNDSVAHVIGSSSYAEELKKLRFSGINGCPETSSALSPIFRSKSTRAFQSKTSLFFPLIIDPGEHHCYSICASKLLAVDNGKAHVAEHITCLIGPLNAANNVGEIILSLFANKVIDHQSWKVHVNMTQHPLFAEAPAEVDRRLIHSFRYFLKQALFEKEPNVKKPGFKSTSNLTPTNHKEMVDTWMRCWVTPDEAGKFL
ncbi:5651_t:CDS:10, partial [Acaulospora morrowiae]